MPIRSVLVANRGEIAVRIIRACREMGIRSVAVYSDPDAAALHARYADEARRIGPAEPRFSYLDVEKIIAVALEAGCDAIHPGYGFLSERAVFAEAVTEAGLVFIGPPAAAIRAMGDKTAARSLMQARGVPVIPGSSDAVETVKEAQRSAEELGFPVLLKAAAGGGGKGMRVVDRSSDLRKALASARNEAQLAFGDGRVFLEKYVVKPRHIEFQIVADAHGNIVHLGERECSIQRRYQKVIEESPSSFVTPELRERMGRSAVEAARACGYVNAGTIEFLVDADRNFYFLEMNTRLQVEHPVTELVTGVDLVKTQILIAQGEPLPWTQEEIQFHGHAIESRICAEDVRNQFFPSTGVLDVYRPSQGFGVREDSGVEEGSEISMYYDPMFSKLIAWGTDRGDAIAKMKRALDDYRIAGVDTTIPFCRFVMDHPAFVTGDFQIDFVARHFRPEFLESMSDEEINVSAIAAVLFSGSLRGMESGNGQSLPARHTSRWKERRAPR